MATCAIIEGFTLDCKGGAGGLKTIYLTEFDNVTQANIVATSGAVTSLTMTGTKKFFSYQIRPETADLKEDPKPGLEAGTLFYEQTVTFELYKMNAKNRNIIDLLLKNRLLCIVETINGELFLLGQTRGLDISTASGTSGKMMGDFNGTKITLHGKEPNGANTITQAIVNTIT